MKRSVCLPSLTLGARYGGRVRALLTFELLFLLPFLLVMFLSLVEFSALLVGEAKISAAAREGARVAAMGGDEAAVGTVFGTAFTAKLDLTKAVTVAYPNTAATTGNPVQVQVCVAGNLLAPNFLCVLGFDLSTKSVCSQTTMTIE